MFYAVILGNQDYCLSTIDLKQTTFSMAEDLNYHTIQLTVGMGGGMSLSQFVCQIVEGTTLLKMVQ